MLNKNMIISFKGVGSSLDFLLISFRNVVGAFMTFFTLLTITQCLPWSLQDSLIWILQNQPVLSCILIFPCFT